MPQDAFTLKAIVSELNTTLIGGKVNKINQPNNDEVIFTVYTGKATKKLVMSTNASFCRVGFTTQEKANPLIAPNFCMLLRKHLSGATIKNVSLDFPERVVCFTFGHLNDFKEEEEKKLYLEIMGKYSNAILTQNGLILGSLKTPGIEVNSFRPMLAGMKYTSPPPQDKENLLDKEKSIPVLLSYQGGDLGEFLFNRFKGVASSTANEIAYEYLRANPSENQNVNTFKFYDFIINFINNSDFAPCTVGSGKEGDFFAITYQSVSGEILSFPTVNEAQDKYYSDRENTKSFENKYRQIYSKITAYEKKLLKKEALLLERKRACGDVDTLKIKGELLTSFAYAIPKGSDSCVLDNYYSETGEKVKISLDKNLSANENAQKYFKKYRKQKKTLEAIAPQIEEVENELLYVASVKNETELCTCIDDFNDIEEELIFQGIIKDATVKNNKKNKNAPLICTEYLYNGYTIRMGKNNIQNERLGEKAKNSDLWLHTKDFHSSHVFIESKGSTIPDDVILVAAEICVSHSKAKGGTKIPVDYTLKKYVKKPSGAKPGFVNYFEYKTCYADSDPHAELTVR